MPRRNRKSPAEGLVYLVARLPWWLCLIFAVISYFGLSAVANHPPTIAQSAPEVRNLMVGSILRGLATAGQYILPIIFLGCAILSAVLSHRKSEASVDFSNVPLIDGSRISSATGEPPTCPQCNAPMVQRNARRGANVGEAFWGCSHYPDCKGTRRLV